MRRVTAAAAAAATEATRYWKIGFAEFVALAKVCGAVAVNFGALWMIFRGLRAAMDGFWTARGALPLSTRWE